MKIKLHRYRQITDIETIEEAIEIAKTLSGGDFGLITITFDSETEREEFDEKYEIDIDNQGEWRFYNNEHN